MLLLIWLHWWFFYQLLQLVLTTWLRNNIPNSKTAIRKLKFLNARIDSSVTQEFNLTAFKEKIIQSGYGFKKAYPIASARDIEIALIGIFEYIGRIRFLRPRFIFVFDELDKIEAHHNTSIEQKEKYSAENDNNATNAELTRKRQQTTSRILANLKHFFTTAKAKFIFIAGREMYDATLADINDRNYFLGSIFHDVIYINSFLTEDPNPLNKGVDEHFKKKEDAAHTSYYHGMAEEFLCQFLMPKKFFYKEKGKMVKARLDNPKSIGPGEERKSISLKTYNLYLKNHSELKNDPLVLRRVIMMLNQFITYLAHRSSGSPKKLTHLLENYICKNSGILFDQGKKEYLDIRSIVAKRGDCSPRSLFLHFDYYSQYTFGVIDYLTVPYYYNISRYVRRYNDKLMVSTAYLLDHLYKFHDFGFSWRNLEVTPEIIDVNKAPTLRKLIEEIVNFLGNTHLQYVVSGLYDFKFKKKISYEINFLSKVSERESAAMNFTLDESQEVKAHFKRKLEQIVKDYGAENTFKYIHSKGYIQQSLGDLHYYDQEYDDASIMYKDAIQHIIRDNDKESRNSLRLVVIICRIMLKMGITFERKKAYTSAFMVYGDMADLVIKSIEIELKKLGLVKRKDEHGNIFIHKRLEDGSPDYSKDTTLSEYDKNYFGEILRLPLFPKTHSHLFKSATAETVRLLYQPFVAKLYVQDKEKIGGITDADIKLALADIAFLTKITNPQIEKLILAEYHNKVGDLLYFINYRAGYTGEKESEMDKYNKFSAQKLYRTSLQLLGDKNKHPIDILFDNYIDIPDFVGSDKVNFRFEEIKMIASNLSDLGDAYMSAMDKTALNAGIVYDIKVISLYFDEDVVQDKSYYLKRLFDRNKGFSKPLVCYFLSYFFYKWNNDSSKASFQCIKAMHLIEQSSSYIAGRLRGKSEREEFIQYTEKMVKKVLSFIYRSYSASTRQEIERMKEIFKLERKDVESNFNYILNNLPSISEVNEILMLYRLLKLRLCPPESEDVIHEAFRRI